MGGRDSGSANQASSKLQVFNNAAAMNGRRKP